MANTKMGEAIARICLLAALADCLCHASLLNPLSTKLCGDNYNTNNQVHLTKSGETSSVIVNLSAIEESRIICKLTVTAPSTHVINMHFVETVNANNLSDINGKMRSGANETRRHRPCMMHIYLSENPRTPVWKGDLCSSATPLPGIDLLTPGFRIFWEPPLMKTSLKVPKFALTAVGQGNACKEPGQHTCMRIGWNPMLCVSDYLICDGIRNCPRTATTSDEDEQMCRKHLQDANSWQKIAIEIFKHIKPPQEVINNNKWLHDKLEQDVKSSTVKHFQHVPSTTIKAVIENKQKATDSFSQALAKYGPWGYLMLGMLICGTVLMFCGLWECCVRQAKAHDDVAPPSATQPTTVLIINGGQDELPRPPPNYDDLDQPPSYTTLFPNMKRNSSTNDVGSGRSNNNNNNNNNADHNNEQQRHADNDVDEL